MARSIRRPICEEMPTRATAHVLLRQAGDGGNRLKPGIGAFKCFGLGERGVFVAVEADGAFAR